MSLTQINKAGLDEIALDHVFTIGASGTSAYTFQGEGLNGTDNNPTLYLTRGKTYRFENGTGAHAIRIQSADDGTSGTLYNTGVTNNNTTGTVIVEVQHDSPDVLYYQCASHASMKGIIYSTGALADGGVTTAKLADDAVDNDKLADSVVAAIAANTAKTSNATHTGDVTGSTTLTIATNAVTTTKIAADAIDNSLIADNAIGTSNIANNQVTLAKLEDGTSSNDGKFLRANNGAAPSFETVTTDLVNDTTPQLGGDLASNGSDILMADNDQVKFGTGNDMAIFHNGTDNFIKNPNGTFKIFTGADKQSLLAVPDGGVSLHHNDAEKFITESNGAAVTGRLQVKKNGSTSLNVRDTSSNAVSAYVEVKTEGRVEYNCYKEGVGTKYPHVFMGYTEEYARIDTNGLKFNGDTASANALDDYEEGTYSPTVGRSSGHVKSSGYTTQSGTYTKIGRLVHCTMQIYFTNGFGGSGYYWIPASGLPFTPDTTSTGSLGAACSMVLSRLYVFSSDRAGGSDAMTFKMQGAGNLLLKSIKDNSWHTSGMGNIVVIDGTLTYYTAS